MPVLLYVLAVAVFAQGTSEFVLAGLVPGISADLGVPIAQAGYLTSGFAVGMVVGAPLTATVGRSLPPRWTLSACLAVFVLAHASGALTDSFGVLLGTRFVAALANAGFLAVALSTATRLVPAGRRARALSVLLGGTTLALIAGVPVGALLGELWGWRSALWAIAGLSAAALVAVLWLTPDRPGQAVATRSTESGRTANPSNTGRSDSDRADTSRPDTNRADTNSPDDAGTSTDHLELARPRPDLRAELRTLRSPDLLRHLALGVLVNGATFCAFTYLAVVVTDGAGLGPTLVPVVLALFGLGAFAGVSAAGRLADTRGRLLLDVAGPALLAGWIAWAALADSPTAVWVLAPVQGALSFAVGSTLIARAMAAAQGAPTMGGAFSTVALNLGALLGPVLGGASLGATETAGPLVVSAALVAAAVTLWLVTARRSGAPTR